MLATRRRVFTAIQLAACPSTARWLDACPVDIDAHFLSAVANRETGNHVEAAAHVRWFKGLVESVMRSGSGKSATSPFVTISVDEEYAMLRALQLQPRDNRC